jgi:hypothetical protein
MHTLEESTDSSNVVGNAEESPVEAAAAPPSSVLVPKKRQPTREETSIFHARLLAIVDQCKPASVRQVYYQAVTTGLVEKTEIEYRRVQQALVKMRRSGKLPWDALVDGTRWMRKPNTWASPGDALEDVARLYRKSLWRDAGVIPEVWLEKEALAGVVVDVTAEWDVALFVARGFASLSYLYSAADQILDRSARGQRTIIYHLGDFDPSGRDAAAAIKNQLTAFCGQECFDFVELALTSKLIADHALPLRPTKKSDASSRTRAARFHAKYGINGSVELDALHPDQLRALVRGAIEQHLPTYQLEQLRLVEAAERKSLLDLARYASQEVSP